MRNEKPRKQLLLLAALLVLILTGCEAQDLLSTESRFRFGGYGRLYDDGIPDYRSGTDGCFSS